MPNSLTRSHIETLQALRSRLSETRLHERARFARELDRLFARRTIDVEFEKACSALSNAIDKSCDKVATLRELPLKLNFDPGLPITAHHDEILRVLAARQVIVLCGATGSGKTTQLPKFCLKAGRGALGLIGHTQPRRIAARAIANRLAEELDTNVGDAVGYQVRFNDRVGPNCRVKLMTDGILLKELESDRELRRYDTLIIDEAHERSLNIDLLLGVLKKILARRSDLKLIVTSATIDPGKFSEFFGNAPVIEVSGRSYPVEVRYRPLQGEDEDAVELSLPEGVLAAVRELDDTARGQRGDVLVFLPGEKQIRECDETLSRSKLGNTEIVPLYSRLSTADQERIFQTHAQRRVVLATNVAETSLTVPGIRNVIDSGLARISRYSVRGKVQRLPIERISQASADQRKGRCGRETDGICIRLFGEEDFLARETFTPPEVLRTNLASVILRLAVLELGEPDQFPFLDAPDSRLINDGYRLLQELKAVDDHRRITSLGRQIASLPVDPRLARMLLAATHHKCLSEMLVIASFLEIQDPRERPSDAQQQADQAHAKFADSRSDFISVANLWNAFQEQSSALSGSQLRKWCRERFLSFVRMREWQELHRQLRESVDELELRGNQTPADYASLHQAILSGFLGNIGTLDEKREYLGARGSQFVVAPGSPLAAKPPRWIVAGSLLETTRIYARMVASIEPQWIEAVGEHLLKRSYAEPHWVEQKGFVAAFETVSLYGLTLTARRRINFGHVAPKEARDIFVREALVEGRSALRADFLQHNAKLRAAVESMEAKIRRRDVLVNEQALCEFYLARLPQDMHSIAAMEKWLKSNSCRPLNMSLSDLMVREVPEAVAECFPDTIDVSGNSLPLTYKFEPTEVDDGATLIVPEPLLKTLDEEILLWAIPAWRTETVIALLRALPKEQRKHFVPVPDAAAHYLRGHAHGISSATLAQWVTHESGVPLSVDELRQLPLADHLRINIRLTTLDGRILIQGRDLSALRRGIRKTQSTAMPAHGSQRQVYRAWEFGDLPEQRVVERQAIKFTVYPAIAPEQDDVAVVELGSAADAQFVFKRGLLRLALLALPQQAKFVRQQFNDHKELILLSRAMPLDRPLVESFVERVFQQCFVAAANPLPRTRSDFEKMLEANRGRLGECLERVQATLLEILKAQRIVRHSLANVASSYVNAKADVTAQLDALFADDFLVSIPSQWLEQLPRYLRAIARRLERLPGNPRRDAELMAAVAPFVNEYRTLLKQPYIAIPPQLELLRWMIEEYRVSLFAQDLKTSLPVSDKRLKEQVQRAKEATLRQQ